MLSLPLTNAKHVCSDANALEQSTLLPAGPDAATGAGAVAVGASTGTGVAVGVAAAGAATGAEGTAAAGDGTVPAGAAAGAVAGGAATGAVTGAGAMVGATVGGAGGLVTDFGAIAGATAATKEPHWMVHKSNATIAVTVVAPCIILITIVDQTYLKVEGTSSAVFKTLHLQFDSPELFSNASLASFQFLSRTSPEKRACE